MRIYSLFFILGCLQLVIGCSKESEVFAYDHVYQYTPRKVEEGGQLTAFALTADNSTPRISLHNIFDYVLQSSARVSCEATSAC